MEKIIKILEEDDEKQLEIIIKGESNIILTKTDDLPLFLQNSPNILAAAAFYGAFKCYSMLKKNGYSINSTDSFETPLSHFSIFGENIEIMNDLFNNRVTFTGAVFVAIENKKMKALEWLKNHGFIWNTFDERGFNVGLCAALTNDEKVVSFVISNCRCFPNLIEGEKSVILFLLKNDLDISAEILINTMNNVDLKSKDENGDTPLTYAKKNNKNHIAEIIEDIEEKKRKAEEDKEKKECEKNEEENEEKDKKNQSKCCVIF